jgi:hypothetical protein
MKTKFAVFTIALLSLCMLIRPGAMAIGISIDLGDRPYYEGPSYWDDGYEWVWIPGHWSEHHREWIHGHYVRRGEWHREHREHHRHHHHDHDGDEHHDHDHDHDHHH